MPELPEVEAIRRALVDPLCGKRIEWTEVLLPRIVRAGSLREVEGKSVLSIERQGKFLWFDLSGGMKLFAHMRMSGTLLWYRFDRELPSHVRAIVQFPHGNLLFRDIRTLGGLWVVDSTTVPWKKLGVDPFDPRFTPDLLKKKLLNRRISIKQALLDQTVIAGVGNIYASEILFQCGIDPRRRACDLSGAEFNRLHFAVLNRLSAAIRSKGTTFRDFRLSDGKSGEFRRFLRVYSKTGDKCNRCGEIIRRIVQAQRSSYFCPGCQI